MDALYAVDEGALERHRQSKPWMSDPKYFKRVRVSPSAAMKMMMHAHSGVEKGIKANGTPVEVMGLMLGRPCTDDHHALIVTDVFPLPVEGAETRVLADDQQVMNYMIELGESLELTRKERFMGWYHSHPFDVEVNSHCFLSSTDVSTQLAWQRAEDAHGNPWLAIVIDPLRSLSKGKPELGAFRVYPPEYSPPANEAPDGRIVPEEAQRVERWGSCWNRYYTLEVSYFMSSLASNVTQILTKNFLWMQTFSSTPVLEPENRDRLAERITGLSDKLETFDAYLSHGASAARMSSIAGLAMPESTRSDDGSMSKSAQSSCDLAIEQCQSQFTQLIKSALFAQQQCQHHQHHHHDNKKPAGETKMDI